ncbi:MAG: UDP-N-acetylmuramate--L-alanine ligase [Anaerolineae bacterium]|nr:UDP-N-acetylmuramate--L-alanine ligase [Anaerolineae bacterium]
MKRHVHFIGVGGSGLSAIATVLQERGETVSGSDRQASATTRRLQERGMTIMIGHDPQNVSGADLVVRSSAVADDHVEVQAALRLGIPVLKRMDFLGELIAGQRAIAIAGSHGKTTTTALVAWVLDALGEDPSFVIGGWSVNFQKNAGAGSGKYFVIEADEYDRMFLGLHPWIAVVTTIEYDHPDYFSTPADFRQAFEEFVNQIQPGGALIVGTDDAGARELYFWAKAAGLNCRSYSISDERADYCAIEPRLNEKGGYTFGVARAGARIVDNVSLQIPGLHNVANALAALAVVDSLGLAVETAARACEEFLGAARRFDLRGAPKGIMIFDDYAHHPPERRATLSAARLRYPGKRIWAVWQPHTFSRTRALLADFGKAFTDADRVVVTEIFAAREQPPADGFSGAEVAAALKTSNPKMSEEICYQPDFPSAVRFLLQETRPEDIVIVLSAGDADMISANLLDELAVDEYSAEPPSHVRSEE